MDGKDINRRIVKYAYDVEQAYKGNNDDYARGVRAILKDVRKIGKFIAEGRVGCIDDLSL